MTKLALTRTTNSFESVTLTVSNGYSAEQVLALLNSGEAMLQRGEIIIPPTGCSEGYAVLARVTSSQVKAESSVWAIPTVDTGTI